MWASSLKDEEDFFRPGSLLGRVGLRSVSHCEWGEQGGRHVSELLDLKFLLSLLIAIEDVEG